MAGVSVVTLVASATSSAAIQLAQQPAAMVPLVQSDAGLFEGAEPEADAAPAEGGAATTHDSAASTPEDRAAATAVLLQERALHLEEVAKAVQVQEQAVLAAQRAKDAEAERKAQAELARIKALSTYFWPTAGSVSSGFGNRLHPIDHVWRLHTGADIGGACGQPIWAAQAGTVVSADGSGYNGGAGHNVRIQHGTINGARIDTAYLHMDRIEVSVGQRVEKGERIGTVGSTGSSTACHLHFSVYKNGSVKDPLPYLNA